MTDEAAAKLDEKSDRSYTGIMDIIIEFNPEAFKHGVDEVDIRKAFDTAVYDGLLYEPEDDDARDKYLLVGFNRRANPIEILYNVMGEYHINVYHAMPCSSIYHHLLKPEEQ
ncbi:MAG: hypothetical protein LBD08_04855 [Treponema sp.]|nr:hypothetical protein [Treponema sp.]